MTTTSRTTNPTTPSAVQDGSHTPDIAFEERRTDRLVIRRFRAEDASTLAAYRSNPKVARYQSWDSPFTLAQADQVVQARAVQFAASQGDQRPHRVEHGHVGQVPVGLLQLVAQHRDVEPDVVGGDDDRLSVACFEQREQREQLVRDVVEARFAGEMVVADVVDGVRDRVDWHAGIHQTLPTATDRAVPAGDRADRHATAGRAVRVSVVSVSSTTRRRPCQHVPAAADAVIVTAAPCGAQPR